ncbi:unnamed protein product [Heligmosomoides polygyrus]|uniref:DUF1778 domain-containing protein n=1 Tax=Heligmosomoides polygyrus TaxID=6339 RepID=A0A183G7Z2_HELPZ|nr:unnamed protein product [Heligmosomoides polygyrus]
MIAVAPNLVDLCAPLVSRAAAVRPPTTASVGSLSAARATDDTARLQDITPTRRRALAAGDVAALQRGRALGDAWFAAEHEMLPVFKLLN